MTRPLRKIRIGQRLKSFPGNTFAGVVDDLNELRSKLSTLVDARTPKAKSPVIVQLVWGGEDPVDAGSTVKLGNAVFDPSTDAGAPCRGLSFHCDAFGEGDELRDFAITLDQIKGGGEGVGYGVMPNCYWARVVVSDDSHTRAVMIAGTTFNSSTAGGRPIVWKPALDVPLTPQELWCVVKLEGGSTNSDNNPSIQVFRLLQDKALAQPTASVAWIDNEGNQIGEPGVVHDPGKRFAGRAQDYFFSEDPVIDRAFVGIAALRRDLALEDPDRWEIVAMEGFAKWIQGQIVVPDTGSGGGAPYALFDIGDYHAPHEGWETRWPAPLLGDVKLHVVDEIYKPVDGDVALLQLVDPDTTPPTYEVYAVKRRVQFIGGDEDGTVLIRSVEGLSAEIDGAGTLTITLDYKRYRVLGSEGNDGEFEAEVDIWDVQTEDVVTNVACDGDDLSVTSESIDILIPPD